MHECHKAPPPSPANSSPPQKHLPKDGREEEDEGKKTPLSPLCRTVKRRLLFSSPPVPTNFTTHYDPLPATGSARYTLPPSARHHSTTFLGWSLHAGGGGRFNWRDVAPSHGLSGGGRRRGGRWRRRRRRRRKKRRFPPFPNRFGRDPPSRGISFLPGHRERRLHVRRSFFPISSSTLSPAIWDFPSSDGKEEKKAKRRFPPDIIQVK